MISKELLNEVDSFMLNLNNKFSHLKLSKNEKIMSHSMKLSEELGELNSEILIKFGIARQEKIDNYSEKDLENELADVLLSFLILSKELDIDINKSVINKINKIKERGGI